MYSIVLMAAMTTTTEAPGFGDKWAKHCFWECCLPARYGWVACGPAYQAFYPASYLSCCGCGGYSHHTYSCGGCSCGGCGGCRGFGGCGGCGGFGGCGGCFGGCIGGYYNCYGGGGGSWPNLLSGIGYAGFGAYGNYGNYGTVPVYAAPAYASPFPMTDNARPFEAKPADIKPGDASPLEIKPTEIKPTEIKPLEIKPIEVKPLEIKPLKTMAAPQKASVVVRVPAKAKVYIDNNLMTSTSTERKFSSPALEPGEAFYYTIRVVAQKDGKEVEVVREVTVKAGEVSRLAFDTLFDRVGNDERTVVNANRKPIE